MWLVFFLFILLVVYGVFEYRSHKENLKKIPIRILVNGTRGKTTLTRLIAYSLMEKGIKTVARTSGSSLEVIHSDGSIEKTERKKRANIIEMLSFFSMAANEKAEAVVIECMALGEENQRTMGDTLVKPNIVIITNTFIDHVPEMGRSIEETAWCLSRSVPKDALLFVTEDYYDDFGIKVKKVEYKNTTPPSCSIPIHPSSWALAKAVLSDMGIDESYLLAAKDKIPPDVGLLKDIRLNHNSVFVPTFSINDRECMKDRVLEKTIEYPEREIIIVFNNRKDREHRIILLKEALSCIKSKIKVYTIGDYKKKTARYFTLHQIEAFAFTIEELEKEIRRSKDTVFIGLGNIKGDGERLISLIMEDKKCCIQQ